MYSPTHSYATTLANNSTSRPPSLWLAPPSEKKRWSLISKTTKLTGAKRRKYKIPLAFGLMGSSAALAMMILMYQGSHMLPSTYLLQINAPEEQVYSIGAAGICRTRLDNHHQAQHCKPQHGIKLSESSADHSNEYLHSATKHIWICFTITLALIAAEFFTAIASFLLTLTTKSRKAFNLIALTTNALSVVASTASAALTFVWFKRYSHDTNLDSSLGFTGFALLWGIVGSLVWSTICQTTGIVLRYRYEKTKDLYSPSIASSWLNPEDFDKVQPEPVDYCLGFKY